MIFKIQRDDINNTGYRDDVYEYGHYEDIYINTKNICTLEYYFRFLKEKDYEDNKTYCELGLIINGNRIPLSLVNEDDYELSEKCEDELFKTVDKIADIMSKEK